MTLTATTTKSKKTFKITFDHTIEGNLKVLLNEKATDGICEKQGKWCVMLNKFQVEGLMGIKTQNGGLLQIDQAFDKNQLDELKAWAKEQAEKDQQKEIDSLCDEDIVTLNMFVGSGVVYSLVHEKLSSETGRSFGDAVKTIKAHDLVKLNATDSIHSYTKQMTFKEFKKLSAEADRLEKEENAEKQKGKEAVFAKAKATGEPQILSKVVVPEEHSSLASDGEGDMVDEIEFAMPDGSVQHRAMHNY